jgi:hypothetical protein
MIGLYTQPRECDDETHEGNGIRGDNLLACPQCQGEPLPEVEEEEAQVSTDTTVEYLARLTVASADVAAQIYAYADKGATPYHNARVAQNVADEFLVLLAIRLGIAEPGTTRLTEHQHETTTERAESLAVAGYLPTDQEPPL